MHEELQVGDSVNLDNGDEIFVGAIFNLDNFFTYLTVEDALEQGSVGDIEIYQAGSEKHWRLDQISAITGKLPKKASSPKDCTCSINILMASGCKCGSLSKESGD